MQHKRISGNSCFKPYFIPSDYIGIFCLLSHVLRAVSIGNNQSGFGGRLLQIRDSSPERPLENIELNVGFVR